MEKMKEKSEIPINNTYVGNVMEGVPKIWQWVFARVHKIDKFLTPDEVKDQFDMALEETRAKVFWTVSQGTFKVGNKYCRPTGVLSGIPKRYDFSKPEVRSNFFRETNRYAFDTEKSEGEKRYAILGTENPGQFVDELREHANLFDGVKFGAYRKLQLNTTEAQESMQKIVEVCKENNWPMLIHTSIVDFRNNEGLEGIYMLAKRNPEVNVCVSHMGGDISKWTDEDYKKYLEQRILCLRKLSEIPENLYFNTAVKDLKLVKDLMLVIPELKEQILLASDVPFAFKNFQDFERDIFKKFEEEEIKQFNNNALRYENNISLSELK